MKLARTLLCIFLCLGTAFGTTMTGIVKNASTPIARGHLEFVLMGCSDPRIGSLSGKPAPKAFRVSTDANGSVGNLFVNGTDTVACAGNTSSYFEVKAYSSAYVLLWTHWYQTSGASFDIGTTTPLVTLPVSGNGATGATGATGAPGITPTAAQMVAALAGQDITPRSVAVGTTFSTWNFAHGFNGAVCDDATDDTAAFNALLSTVSTAGGGTIKVVAMCLINGQITLPNNGSSTAPTQASIRITSDNPAPSNGYWAVPTNMTAGLDLRYNAPIAKILTLGAGTLELDRLVLRDGGSDCAAFIQTTNTQLKVHDNLFSGTASGTSACNDAVIFGGTGTTTNNSTSAPFQGYGSPVKDNFFDKIRRGIFLQNFANAVIGKDNTFSLSSGSNLPMGAGIEIDGHLGGFDVGNLFEGNLFESGNYPYSIKTTAGIFNSFIANNFYDPSPTTLGYYWVDPSSYGNTFIDGFHDGIGGRVLLTGDPNYQNTVITSYLGETNIFPANLRLGAVGASTLQFGNGIGLCGSSNFQLEVNDGICRSGNYKDLKIASLYPTASVQFTLGNGSQWPNWLEYQSGTNLYVRDLANGVMAGIYSPGPTGTGGLTLDGNLTVNGTAGVFANKLTLDSGGFNGFLVLTPLSANRTYTAPNGNASLAMPAWLSTTAATSDNVTIQGMTAAGHCSLTATNAAAATNIATTFVSAKAVNQITVTHTASASMNYDVMCTPN